jgi:hypothetical protein
MDRHGTASKAVYYDPFTGSPTEYELYDLTCDPLEMTNLAHGKHRTPASQVERARLHRRLSEVMRVCGTIPDEIRWPDVEDFQPSMQLAVGGEGDEDTDPLKES